MASTASLGASQSASSSDAHAFHTSFNERLGAVRASTEAASTRKELSPVAEQLASLRVLLTEKTDVLPSYDRQTHERRLKEAYQQLEARSTQLTPRTKFAFRRKLKPAQQSAALDNDKKSANVSLNKEFPEGETPEHASAGRATTANLQRISKLSRQQVPIITDLEDDGRERVTGLELDNLTECIVDARPGQQPEDTGLHKAGGPPYLSAHMRNLSRCVILAGHIDGSVLVDGCSDCVLVIACRQFRMHKSHAMTLILATDSIATLEACRKVLFAPGKSALQVLDSSHLPEPATEATTLRVQDFDHISLQTPSPSWAHFDDENMASLQAALKTVPHAPDGEESVVSRLEHILSEAGIIPPSG